MRLPGTGVGSGWRLVTPRGRWPCWISASKRHGDGWDGREEKECKCNENFSQECGRKGRHGSSILRRGGQGGVHVCVRPERRAVNEQRRKNKQQARTTRTTTSKKQTHARCKTTLHTQKKKNTKNTKNTTTKKLTSCIFENETLQPLENHGRVFSSACRLVKRLQLLLLPPCQQFVLTLVRLVLLYRGPPHFSCPCFTQPLASPPCHHRRCLLGHPPKPALACH